MTDARATQGAALALIDGSAGARATQAPSLAMVGGSAGARATQGVVLALVPEPSAARATQGAVLAAVGGSASARATQAAVLALCMMVPCLTHWAQCWRIERRDGQVFTFTAHDMPVSFRGETYQPCDSLSASAAEISALIGQIGNAELAGIISDDAITEADLFEGLFDDARVEVWIVPWIMSGI